MVREHMQQAQLAQARMYNRGAQVWEFQPGDKVMVLFPTHESKFLAKWHDPYEVVERVGPVNWPVKIWQPERDTGPPKYIMLTY